MYADFLIIMTLIGLFLRDSGRLRLIFLRQDEAEHMRHITSAFKKCIVAEGVIPRTQSVRTREIDARCRSQRKRSR